MDITQFNASSVPTAITAEVVQEEQNPPTQFSPAQQLFFRDLHNMLMKESSKGCVKWLDGLNGFLILDKDKFLEDTMTRYFGDAKYASFTRRLKVRLFIIFVSINAFIISQNQCWNTNPNFAEMGISSHFQRKKQRRLLSRYIPSQHEL